MRGWLLVYKLLSVYVCVRSVFMRIHLLGGWSDHLKWLSRKANKKRLTLRNRAQLLQQ